MYMYMREEAHRDEGTHRVVKLQTRLMVGRCYPRPRKAIIQHEMKKRVNIDIRVCNNKVRLLRSIETARTNKLQ